MQSIQNVNRKCSSLPNDTSFTLILSFFPLWFGWISVLTRGGVVLYLCCGDCLLYRRIDPEVQQKSSRRTNKTLHFLSSGRRDQDYWQEVRPAGVPVLAENQSRCSPARELPGCRERAAHWSEGLPVRVGWRDRSDGQGLLQHRAQRCV